jgi:hypothetical protein
MKPIRNMLTGEWMTPEPWQQELTVGSCYVIHHPVVAVDGRQIPGAPTVYGEIIDGEGCEEGFFYARAFSEYCPEGEIGLMCITPNRRNDKTRGHEKL